MPSISIIVPTCCRPLQLKQCAEALQAQIPRDGSAEIIVCDDGEDGATRELVAKDFPGVLWHRGPHTGAAANRNFGASLSTLEWLIFVDDDCIPCPGFFQAYLRAISLQTPASQVVFDGATRPIPEKHSLYWEAPSNTTGGTMLISCNFAMPRALFLEIGGFDERYQTYFEDTEFGARLQARGVPMLFVPDAAVVHPVRKLQGGVPMGKKWESRVISSFDFGATAGEVAWLLPRHAALVTLSRFRGQPFCWENLLAAWIYFHEFLYFLFHLPAWIFRHRKSRSPFWASTDNIKHIPPRFGL